MIFRFFNVNIKDMKSKKYHLKSNEFYIIPSDENDLWEKKWDINKKESDETIGWVSFEGKKMSGSIPISIYIDEKMRNRGYAQGALKIMVDWAFLHPNIYEVRAKSEHDNDAYITALHKSGFVYRYVDDETGLEKYTVTKQKPSYLGAYLILGFGVGLALGIVIDILWVGVVIGLVMGFGVGKYFERADEKLRFKVTGRKNENDKSI